MMVSLFAAVLAQAAGVQAQSAADYPSKPLRVVVGSAPGGGTDVQARLFAVALGEAIKQGVVVDNRPGAGDVISIVAVQKAPADGYTLLAMSPTFTFAPALQPNVGYDPIKDFSAISQLVKAPFLILANPKLPVNSISQLVALAKAKPGTIDAAMTPGSTLNLVGAYLELGANIKLSMVPYKSSGQTLVDTIAGQTQVTFSNILASLPHVKSGKLRALGVTGSTRSPIIPDLPTVAEQGVPGYEITSWHGWVAPANTPSPVIRRLNSELNKIVNTPDIAKKISDSAGEPVGTTPEEFAQLLAAEVPRWRKVVQASGMKMSE